MTERIAKRLSRSGVCSRREAERMIIAGRVSVGDRTLKTPATLVSNQDVIKVDGKKIKLPERVRLWRYHKPPRVLCTNHDDRGRPTLFEQLPKNMPRSMLVGRLDFNSEGLILLTNDGVLARKLELPSTGWARRYRVRVFGQYEEKLLASLQAGVLIDGIQYGPIEAITEEKKATNSWLRLSLREGKNREIRRVMSHIGLEVSRLIRVSYGPFHLGNLPRGGLREIPASVIEDQTGLGKRPETKSPRPK
ncbi:MAG: pseudouridine synthase [Pseudomonadota bacterium]|nr:pseudouridine synthase [Pseudomonadota bacterium]